MSYPIRYIVESFGSQPDIYGNTYWYSIVTSTKTGNRIIFVTPHYSNSESMVAKLIDYRKETIYTTYHYIPIRKYNAVRKTIKLFNSCEDKEIIDQIRKLGNS